MRLYLKRICCVAVAMMLFVASAMATSCFPKREVRGLGVSIEGVSHISHLSTSGMNLWLDVKNERGRIVVNRAKVEIAVDGVKQLELSLREKVVVRGHRIEKVLVPLRFDTRNSLNIGRLLRKAIDGRGKGLTISFKVRGGTLLFRRTITEDNISLRDVAALLDMDFISLLNELRKINE
jgi:hypothetical protein